MILLLLLLPALCWGQEDFVNNNVQQGVSDVSNGPSTPGGVTYNGTGVASGSQPSTFAWATANSCTASPGWNPMPAYQGGTNADVPLSATNQTYTCDVSTVTSGDTSLFGNKTGLRALGIGTARLNDAWSAAAGACWIDATPTGFGAVTEGTNIHYRFAFRPTTTTGTKAIIRERTSAAEYRELEMASAITWRLREGSSGNQTVTHTPTLNFWHLYDLFYVSDCNGDSGNPCVYCYYDGGPCESTGGTMTPGTELGVNMGDFGATTSLSLFCDTAEGSMWNGEFLFLEEDQGTTLTNRYGANAAAWETKHRSDCRDMGICSSDTTIMPIGYGQSNATGFNATTTSGVTATAGTAVANVPTNHGISVGDLINTTGLSTNDTGVTVSAVSSNTVSYPTAGNGVFGDGNGTITDAASTRTQAYNDREGRNNGTLPMQVEGTAGASNAYESPLTSLTNQLHLLRSDEQYVSFERAITNTSIAALNEDTGDGTDTTTNYDNIEVWANELDDRVANLGTTPIRAFVWYDNGEGGTGGTDYDRQNWNEYFNALQTDLDEDLKAITGQSDEVFVCFQQTNNWTNDSRTVGTIAQEQLDAHELMYQDGRAAMAGPKYQYFYSDGTHLTADDYKRSGRILARCADSFLDGVDWSPTRPTAVTISGNDINLTVYTPTPPLVSDTTTVTDPSGVLADLGFEYFDTDPAANPTIGTPSFGSCTGNSCPVTFPMSGTPDHAGARLRYAWTGTSGQPAGALTGARGNIRDSETSYSGGARDANWLVAFDKPITRTFVDDNAWDFDGALEECSSADDDDWEAVGDSTQTLDGLVIDAWVKVGSGFTNDKNIFSKGNNSTHNWSLLVETAGGGYGFRLGVVGVANFVQFTNEACTTHPECSVTSHAGSSGFTVDRWVHFVGSLDLSKGTMATDEIVIASNVATARIPAGVPSYIVAGQTVTTTGLTASGNTTTPIIAVTDGTHFTYAVTCSPGCDGTLADSVGVATVNDAKIRAFAAQCDAGTPPTCGSLTELQGITNGSMPTAFSNNTQPLRIGGFASGVSGTYYYGGEIGELAFWYNKAIDADGSTRSYNVTEVRECLQSATNKPVDHAQKAGYTYTDGVLKSCNWPELRAWYRMGDLDSGTTLLNHAWYSVGSAPAAMTCVNNTGSDIVSDSID